MGSLIQKIFGKREENTERTQMSADEIKPFFDSLGVDIETVGFPGIDRRYEILPGKYNVSFCDVKATPLVDEGNKLKVVIKGEYRTRAYALLTCYDFLIEDGELRIDGQRMERLN